MVPDMRALRAIAEAESGRRFSNVIAPRASPKHEIDESTEHESLEDFFEA